MTSDGVEQVWYLMARVWVMCKVDGGRAVEVDEAVQGMVEWVVCDAKVRYIVLRILLICRRTCRLFPLQYSAGNRVRRCTAAVRCGWRE